MSDWEGRLKAVASLAQPPVYQDGEIECLNPTCRNTKLNRADRNCWKCGLDRFAPASEEMRHALRFNYVPPPRMESPVAEKPASLGIATVWAQYLNSPHPPLHNAAPSSTPQHDAYQKAIDDFNKQLEQFKAGQGLAAKDWDDPPKKRGLMDKLRAIANWKVPL